MEPKPFSIKAPEEVASAYGGNKQKIAQAIQMGALDPTSGLLAGMFIDRMRSAQAMEQAPQQSVAQQVFAPPAPSAPPAGLGAIAPQGGGMPAPQGMQMASAAPQGPVGMAAGGMTELPDSYGLESLPIPDNMYNEESFAGGGIVAFAKGSPGEVEEEGFFDRLRSRDFTGRNREPTEDELRILKEKIRAGRLSKNSGDGVNLLAALNKPYEGPRGSNLMASLLPDFTGNAEDAQRDPRTTGSINNLGEITRTLAAQFSPPPSDPAGLNALIASNNPNVRPASDADKPYGSPNAARRAAAKVDRERGAMVAPSPRGERGVVGGATRAPTTTEKETTPAAGTDTPNAMTLEEIQKRIDEAGKPPEFQRTSAEELAARKNEDLWSTLAQIGFGMAAGESPNFLTNVGKATAAATPAMQEAIKERRKDTKEERNREFDYLVKKAGIKGDNFKSAYTIFNSMQDREQQATLEQMRIKAQETENRLNREVQRRGQDITAAGQKITADYYNSLSEKDQRNVEYYANILFKAGKAKTIEEARAIVFNQLNPIPVRSSTNVGSLQDRILAGGNTGGKGGNMIDYGSLE